MKWLMKKTLLLSCCAPCSCAVIERFVEQKIDFAVLFYNPNIHPKEEYEKRRKENQLFCEKRGVEFICLKDNDEKEWFEQIKGLEEEPERSKRCSVCFYMRLKKAMIYAKENGFDCVTSVLGVSRYKDLDQVNQAAKKASLETGVFYDETNWRKNGREELRKNLIKSSEMYAQNYCGCVFSKR